MPDEKTALQKIEPDKHWLVRIGENPKVKGAETIAKIGGIFMTPSILSALVGYIYGLPVYLYIPLAALVFFLVSAGWYFISFRPKYKQALAENQSLKELAASDVKSGMEPETGSHEIAILTGENHVLKG